MANLRLFLQLRLLARRCWRQVLVTVRKLRNLYKKQGKIINKHFRKFAALPRLGRQHLQDDLGLLALDALKQRHLAHALLRQ